MSRFDALDPTPEEVARLTSPLRPGDIARAREWTAPTPEEIARLAAHRPRPRRIAVLLAPALAAAAALLLQLTPTPPPPVLSAPIPPAVVYAAPAVPIGTPHTLSAPLALGPSITVEGDGEIQLLAAGEGGTVLELLAGSATFEVIPDGLWRDLAVHVGAVTVVVTGTRFTVTADPVSVHVERGAVRVLHPDGEDAVTTGGSWRLPASIHEVILPPPPIAVVPQPAEVHDPNLTAALSYAEIHNAREAGADTTDLLRLIDAFVDEHPRSPLVEEATAWRLTLLREQHPPEELLSEVDAWLSAWPKAHRRGEVLLLRADLTRQTGDCTLASAYYRAVLEERAAGLHSEAQQWLAWCERP